MSTASPQRAPRLSCILALLPLVLGCAGPGGGGPAWRRVASEPPRRDPGYDVLHYALDLEIDEVRERLEGRATIELAATRAGLERVALDLVGLGVEGVFGAQGEAMSFTQGEGSLVIRLGAPLGLHEEVELTVHYGGRPVTGLWFTGHSSEGSVATQVFTQGQPEDSRGWFPCFDDPRDRATFELRVSLPEGWVAVAPGERVGLSLEGGRRVEHWRMTTPHPCYLASLAAGRFTEVEERFGEVPLLYLCEPRHAAWIPASLGHTARALAFLEELTGVRYPYSKYSQVAVANFPSGGMENISATTLNDAVLEDERAHRDDPRDLLVVHEAAHQWFGNRVTAEDWSHLWLNEGFATYASYLWAREALGEEAFRRWLFDAQERNLGEDRGARRRPTVSGRCVEPGDLFDTRAYEGAAARLHLLSTWMGEAAFRRGLRSFLRENAGRGVTTGDLRRAMEASSDVDLAAFFEDWIHGAGFPELDLRWEHDGDAGELLLEVTQRQAASGNTPHVFRFPVDVAFDAPGGPQRQRLFVDRRRATYRLSCPEAPRWVDVDPDGDVPMRARWQRSAGAWLALAQEGLGLATRVRAVRALGSLQERASAVDAQDQRFVPALSNLALGDPSPWIRTTAVESLARVFSVASRETLRRVIREDDGVEVRVAALRGLRAYGVDADHARLAGEVFDAGESYGLMAAALELHLWADPEAGEERLRLALGEASPHDLLAARLVPLLGLLEREVALGLILERVDDPELDPRARAVAVLVWASLAQDRPAASRRLGPLLEHRSFRLREAVVTALVGLGDPDARRLLLAYYPRTRRASERRAIESFLDGA